MHICILLCYSYNTGTRDVWNIYCTEARGRKPRGLSAIYAMHPECTCYN